MEDKFFVAVTAIIKAGDRVLITQRHPDKKKWPGKWTVPGGRVEQTDFIGTPTAINNQWYNTLENAVRREVQEETGLEIDNIKYLCDIAVPDTIIVSFTADLVGNAFPELQPEECVAYAWIRKEDVSSFDLIDGIGEELIWALEGR